MSDYRKIYEKYHGPIPVDEQGRKYDVHHIDGDHSNNDPSNLRALSIKEHYNIHYKQGEYGAAQKIALRMETTSEEISQIAKRTARKRIIEGTHHFLDGNISRKTQKRRLENGTHHFLGPTVNNKRVAAGTHPFLDGSIATKSNLNRLAAGIHPSQVVRKCPHCSKTGRSPGIFKHHFDRCKAAIP